MHIIGMIDQHMVSALAEGLIRLLLQGSISEVSMTVSRTYLIILILKKLLCYKVVLAFYVMLLLRLVQPINDEFNFVSISEMTLKTFYMC